MKLNVKALALSAGVAWGGAVLVVAATAAYLGVKEGGSYYGKEFLLWNASVYPGYTGTPGWGNAVVGGLYGLVDGLVCGAIFAWLYNRCSCCAGGGTEPGSAA